MNYPSFFRCRTCSKVRSRDELVRKAQSANNPRCSCGSGVYIPTKPTVLEEIFYILRNPRSLQFIFKEPVRG